ncbi:MAG: SGNH/GDSL hydrolase family protein [Gammaproteobacteria bacterium]|nr:SGNH/GDSL hydrolase family protein [Gammaproteobacteria bacterium]NND54763.1 SGNH/GDSL hydrolase family protein [Gammaproteobacteria bacterium]
MNINEILKGLAAMCVSLIIFLVLLEVTLQIYTRVAIYYDVEMSRYATELKQKADNPNIGHVHRPGAEAHLMGVDVKINSDGFRDEEYSLERTAAHRIVVLGDSLTFGWGVEQEDTYEAILERELGQIRPVEMINTGHGNYNTVQQVNLLREKGLAYNPDKVVVFFFINDAEVTPVRSKWTPIARLRSVTFLWSRVRGLLTRTAPGQTFESFYSDLYEDDQPGFVAMKEAFLELQGLCEERGIQLQVVMIPELHNLTDYPFSNEYRKVYDFLQANNIAAIDLTDDFATYTEAPETLWVALDDAHPNAPAHRMIADFSKDFIARGSVSNE